MAVMLKAYSMSQINRRNSGGRPPTPAERKDDFLRKLEPHLKAGLSVNKACLEAEAPKSTVYDLIQSDEGFSEKIQCFKNYIPVLTTTIISRELTRIHGKVQRSIPPNQQDLKFVQWVALNNNLCVEEFGSREHVEIGGSPEERIRRTQQLIDEAVAELDK